MAIDVAAWANQVLDDLGLEGGFAPVTLRVEEVRLTSPDALRERLEAWASAAGWVGFQSRVLRWPEDGWPEDAGLPLTAELALDERRSACLLPDGAGGWIWTVFEESPGGDGEWLAEDVSVAGNDRAPGRLMYRRYWRRGPEGYAPVAARFIGFGKEGRA